MGRTNKTAHSLGYLRGDLEYEKKKSKVQQIQEINHVLLKWDSK